MTHNHDNGCCGLSIVSKEDFEALVARLDDEKRQRAEKMPDEQAALAQMFEAWLRLKELGWREAIYCPKDGTVFDAIEPGSTGIHDCHYQGDWPKGSWWAHEAGDLWRSRPAL